MIVPRGGKGLVQRVQDEARVPVFAHLEGICHTYVDAKANLDMARDVVVNAKMRRTGVCGATECLLVDRNAPASTLPVLIEALIASGAEVRGDAAAQAADGRVKAASADDYGHEFLDAIIAVKTVDGVEGAMAHIARYGSQHTDAIITRGRGGRAAVPDRGGQCHRALERVDASSRMAASSASARRSASRPVSFTRAGRSASNSSRASSTSCAAPARSGRCSGEARPDPRAQVIHPHARITKVRGIYSVCFPPRSNSVMRIETIRSVIGGNGGYAIQTHARDHREFCGGPGRRC